MPNNTVRRTAKQQSSNHAAALALTDQGFSIFPAGPDKRPLVKSWQAKASHDAAQVDRWWTKWPDAMPALPTGKTNGVAVLDVDQHGDKDGDAALRDLGHDTDKLSPVWVTTPSGGRHILFRWPDGMGNSAAGLPAGVDVRGQGGYVIAPGAANGKGAYKLSSGSLSDDLPDWPKALLPRLKAPEHGEAQPTGLPFSTIVDALMALPNDGDEYAQRDDWLRIGMALHAETGGDEDGRLAFHEWSALHGSYDMDHTDAAWDSFKSEKGVTGNTMIAEAELHGWRDLSLLDDCWTDDELAEADDDWKEGLDPDTLALIYPPEARLRFLSPTDCQHMPARQYVVKGLLGERDIAAVVGAPGAGKSLLAPYLGYAVARGEEVFGLRTRQGGVMYIAAEDAHGMRARVQALHNQYGDADQFLLVDGVSDLLAKDSEDRKELRRTVKDKRPALIIIDTLAVAFPGLEENEAKAMGAVVAVAKSLTKWGAAVVLVHHDTKAGDGLPRGHSLLNGALDLSLHLKRSGTLVGVRPTKNRNGSTDQEMAFSVGTIQLGEDEDGDPITAAICEEEDTGNLPTRGKPLPASSKAALDILTDLLRDRQSIPKSDWRSACLASDAVSAADKADDRGKAFRRALEELARRDLYLTRGDEIRLTIAPEELLGDDDV
jgi:KaiC/GvpD/RAD55 family RecA-like ATPase